MKLISKAVLSVTVSTFAACAPANGFPDDPDNSIAKEHLELADTNADQLLDKDEFKVFVSLEAEDDIGMSRRIKSFNAYSRAFNTLDADKNGGVSLEEIAASRKDRQ